MALLILILALSLKNGDNIEIVEMRAPEVMLPAGRFNTFIPGFKVVVVVVVDVLVKVVVEVVVVVVLVKVVVEVVVVVVVVVEGVLIVLIPKSMYSKFSKFTSGVARLCFPSV